MQNTTRFYIIGFVRNLYFYLPIFTLYLLDYGVSLEIVVFSQIFYSLVQFFAEVPTGLLADKFGQKTSIIIGYTIEALGILTVILFPTAIGAIVCYALGGLSMAFLSGSEEALLFESAKHEQRNYRRAYGTFLSLQTWGMVAGTMLAGVVIYFFGSSSYVGLMSVTVLSLLLCAVLSIFQKSFAQRSVSPQKELGVIDTLKASASLIRGNPTVFNLTIASALTITGEYYLLSVYQPIFLENGVSEALLAITFSVGLIISALLIRRADLIEHYLTLDKIILVLAFILASAYAIFGLSQSPLIAVVAFLVLRSVMGVEAPIVSDYVNEYIPSEIRSTTLSAVSLVDRLSTIILRIVLTGAIALGGIRLSLLMQSAYLLIGGFLAYWLLRRCGCVHRIHRKEEVIA